MDKMKVLVMHAVDYSFKDEDTGRLNEGCSIQYFMLGDHGELLQPVESSSGSGAVGYQRAKCSADIGLRKKITFLPGIFDAEMQMSVGSDGKANFKVVDLDNYQPVDFSRLLTPAPAAARTAAKTPAPAPTA